jgi:hypothetical protein
MEDRLSMKRLQSLVFGKSPVVAGQVTGNPVSSKPLARRTLRVPTIRHFLMLEPSLLEHNGGIVTCCFSQRYRSQAVVKRSNSKSTIEFP